MLCLSREEELQTCSSTPESRSILPAFPEGLHEETGHLQGMGCLSKWR